jgi:hypothetical protein
MREISTGTFCFLVECREAAEKAAERQEKLSRFRGTEEKVSQKPSERIQVYLDRLDEIAKRQDPHEKERGLKAIRKLIYPKFLTKPENITEEYLKNLQLGEFAEERGYDRELLKQPEIKAEILRQYKQVKGQDFEKLRISEKELQENREKIVQDQSERLDNWLSYLTSPEAVQSVPAAFRYWAFAEMLKLGDYDPFQKTFYERSKKTVANFPELNQQALAFVFDAVQEKRTGQAQSFRPEDESRLAEFKKFLQSENFGKLYAIALEHVNSLRFPAEGLAVTQGEWRKYPRGSSPDALTNPLQGFITYWCITGRGYAQSYLSRADLYIYFSQDKDGKNVIPRSCIVNDRKQGITEIRGILFDKKTNAKQHLDDYIAPVVSEKLKAIPGGEKWQETMAEMKKLGGIHRKHLQNQPLTKEELSFLYEIDRPIRETGYGRDPRIQELRSQRNPEEDILILFECSPEQIAHNLKEITQNTKAYVGKLEKGIFDKIQEFNIEHVYASFPEGRIRKETIEIGGKSPKELLSELKRAEINISLYAEDMIKSKDFTVRKETEDVILVRLKVRDLGINKQYPTTDDIYKRIEELGLELCPVEVGPNYRLKYQNQPLGEWLLIGMKQIADRDGYPSVFKLERLEDGLWLYDHWAYPRDEWHPSHEIAFRLRRRTNAKHGTGQAS